MLDRLSITFAGMLAVAPPVGSSSAVSSEALQVASATAGLVRSLEASQSLFGEKAEAIRALDQMFLECSEPDWDGGGAAPVSPVARSIAENFVRALPRGLPMPDFAPEPDGAISLDWIINPCRVFSLSISASNRLAYAWLDGTDKGHGVARFDGGVVPPRIIQGIRATLGGAYAGIGTA